MKEKYDDILNDLTQQHENMIHTLNQWCEINSGSHNVAGLEIMHALLTDAFSSLEGEMSNIPINDSQGIHIIKHPDASRKILLCGHMDTVYPVNSPFQKTERQGDKMIGPGVADMKGGLLIMLKALEVLENSSYAGKIGWEVIINTDEEIGSGHSSQFIEERSIGKHVGLVFEPAFPDGSLVSARKGSANFSVTAKGQAAHAGREFHLGKNAIISLANYIQKADALTDIDQGMTVNIGYIEGGGATNVVPDHALCRINARVKDDHQLQKIQDALREMVTEDITLEEHPPRPPKPFDNKTEKLFKAFYECGQQLNINLSWKPTGGVCDGNNIAHTGIPTIDTLGVVGGNIHTHDEYVLLDSLQERACLTTLFLLRYANDELGDFS